MHLSTLFQKLSRQYLIEYNEIIREIGHRQTAGEARERALGELLVKYLPQRVGIDRGFVIDALGRESLQCDLVLFDKTVGTVFDVSGVKYYPCESVIAVGEVKTDLDSSDNVNDALRKIASVKSLDRSNNGTNKIITGPGVSMEGVAFNPSQKHRDQIFGFVFSSGSMRRETVLDLLAAYCGKTDRKVWPNLLCSLDKFIISYEIEKALYPSAMDAKCIYCTEDSEKQDLLLLFYTILATFVDEAHVARPSFFHYGQIRETKCVYRDIPKV